MALPALPAAGANWSTWGTAVHNAVNGAAQVADVGAPGTPTGDAVQAASVAAIEDAEAVTPTGAWDFTTAPTVAGAPLGDTSSVLAQVAEDFELKASSLVVPASLFYPSLGAPTLTATGQVPYFGLDKDLDEGVTALITLPPHWATFDVAIRYTNTVATGGDVRFRYSEQFLNDGSTLSGVTAIVGVANTAPAQYVVKTYTLATGRAASAGLLALHIARTGTNAADTLAGDAGLIAVILTQTS